MKSSKSELEKRGYLSEPLNADLPLAGEEELLRQLRSTQPTARTDAAARLDVHKDRNVIALLEQLSVESCLYTRLSICDNLQSGSARTAELMIPYLGRIGKNQHKKLPAQVSKKKSYPLPRDLIARALGKMQPDVLPVLWKLLDQDADENNRKQIREAVDALGFLLFYHPRAVTETQAQKVLNMLRRNQEDEVIVWKLMTCLSAFRYEEIKDVLKEYANRSGLIGQEALRSLHLLHQM